MRRLSGYLMSMPRTTGLASSVVLTCLASLAFAAPASAADELVRGFASPPPETKPAVYWYWISDNISKDGITKDLEAMARVGIGEAYIGNIEMRGAHGKIKVLSDEWFDAMAHAFREGRRTGVKVGMFNCPGWSQSGGPWVTADQTMRYLVGSETRVRGPVKFSAKLPAASQPFQDVAVLAYPAPAHDQDTLARHKPTVAVSVPTTRPSAWADDDLTTAAYVADQPKGSPPVEVDLKVDQPFTARSLSLVPGPKRFTGRFELLRADADGRMVPVESFTADRRIDRWNVGPMPGGAVTVAFPAVTSRHFQLRFGPTTPGAANKAMDFAEIRLDAAARLEHVVEKQLGKMHPTPRPSWDSYVWPTQAEPETPGLAVAPGDVRDLTKTLQPDGTLVWDVPPGDWVIERIGMTPTGAKNSPASPEGTGFEIDKMRRDFIDGHYDAYVGRVMAKLSPEDIKAAGHVIADSYEMGSQNWTEGLDDVFKTTYGYDPVPWLPVLTGRLVGSATQSERFLWDLRRLIADRIAGEYVGGLRDTVAKHGLRLWLENYGHWGFPGEFMGYGAQSHNIGGEFWASTPAGGNELGSIELRAAASCVHGYGKSRVSAEAFTSGGGAFQNAPGQLRARGDWAMTEGVNHFVLHVYIHQPYEDRAPGVNAWFGTEFNRKNTWFNQAGAWIDYLRRSHFLLQQGRYAADVAYFIGEDAPKMTGPREPELPAGYSFDFIDAPLIQRLTVRDGVLVLPSGMTYRLLVLPPQATMRPELAAKIKELVAAGGAILGPMPTASPSMQGFPDCDTRVKQTAADVWQDCDGRNKTHATYGQGHVFNGTTVQAALDKLGVAADVQGTDETMPWTHRTGPTYDVYFLSNQKKKARSQTVSFRVTGRQPEVWDAVTGTRRDLPQFTQRDGRTEMTLAFEPHESLFVVFAKPATTVTAAASATTGAVDNFPAPRVVQTLDGPWTVQFDPARGAPASVAFDQLTDWTQHPHPAVRRYSGTATYRQSFVLADVPPGTPLALQTGPLNGMATVRLNDKAVGTIWCAPWRVDLTAAMQPGENRIEIEVANNWINQLLDDAAKPKDQRQTWMAVSPRTKGALPQASGLIGPVVVQRP